MRVLQPNSAFGSICNNAFPMNSLLSWNLFFIFMKKVYHNGCQTIQLHVMVWERISIRIHIILTCLMRYILIYVKSVLLCIKMLTISVLIQTNQKVAVLKDMRMRI